MMTHVQRVLPTGTVTFLFTDIEGSTKLLREFGVERYTRRRWRSIVASSRGFFERHGGVEVDAGGSAFFVAFPTALGALAGGIDACLAGLAGRPDPSAHGPAHRHPALDGEGYVGGDVHRAARIAACGHGGQVLVSASTAALVGTDALRDLGDHRLKDLSAPERIYQLGEDRFSAS